MGFERGHKKNLGRKHTVETKIKIGLKSIGRTNKSRLGQQHTQITKDKISKSHLGIKPWNKGKKLSLEQRRKMSESHKLLVKMGIHPAWKGGISKINNKIRHTYEYRLWRDAVLKKFNSKCVFCNYSGKGLEADHILPFKDYPELRFSIENGRILCKPCHITTETYGKKHR